MTDIVCTYCKCGCGNGFAITFYAEYEYGHVVISTATSGFLALQNGIFKAVKRRIKAAWFMLCGREYCLHDVVLSKEEFNVLLNGLNQFNEKAKEEK